MINSILRKLFPKKQVAFRATIELTPEYEKQSGLDQKLYKSYQLKPNNEYCFVEKGEVVSYEDLEKEIAETIQKYLSKRVNECLDDKPIKDVKVIGGNERCIEIIFTALLKCVGDAVLSAIIHEAIKHIARKLLREKLGRYGNFFDIDVITISPSIVSDSHEKRGSFFYYLLFSNLFLMGIIFGLLWILFHFIKW